MVSTAAVLSDIHGVLPALERVLDEPAIAGAELIVVTGDHTWGPQPVEVLDRLTSLGDRAALLRGNADRELLQMSHGIDIGLADDPLSVWGQHSCNRTIKSCWRRCRTRSRSRSMVSGQSGSATPRLEMMKTSS